MARKRWISSLVKPGRGVEGAERLPVGGLLADLLGELALGRLERVLALLVELAGGDLQQVGDADRLARLADEPSARRRRARRSPTAPGWVTISRLTSAPSSWRNVPRSTLKNLPSKMVSCGDALEAWSSCGRRFLEEGENPMSSIDSSAYCVTRSVGSWLCSVPLATFTHGMPAASKTLASDAPPVAIRLGS